MREVHGGADKGGRTRSVFWCQCRAVCPLVACTCPAICHVCHWVARARRGAVTRAILWVIAGECKDCTAGKKSAVGAASCTDCEAGETSESPFSACKSCTAGTYSIAGGTCPMPHQWVARVRHFDEALLEAGAQ